MIFILPLHDALPVSAWVVQAPVAAFPAETTVTVGAGANAHVYFEMIFEPSADGDFVIQWRSSSSTGGNEVTLQKGSWFEYTAIT